MPFKYCYILPILQGLNYFITFFVCYILSTYVNRDVSIFFPYVSDLGVWSHPRWIFSVGLGVGSVLMFIVFYLRYLQVNFILENATNNEEFNPKLFLINKISIYTVVIATFHVFGVGCIQFYPFVYIHLYCATIAFIFGIMSMSFQTYLAFKIYPAFGNKNLNMFRVVFLIILYISIFLTVVFGIISLNKFKGDDVTKWNKNSGDFKLHLVSTFSEWILICGTVFFLSLYAIEFKSLIIYAPKVELEIIV